MAGTADIREAKRLLERAGLIKNVVPIDLVNASKELGRPLRDALQIIMDMFAAAEGSD